MARVQQLRKQLYELLIKEVGLSADSASQVVEGSRLISGLENPFTLNPGILAKVDKTLQEIVLLETLLGKC